MAGQPTGGGRFRRCLEGHGNTVSGLAALPDGKLVSGSWDCSVRVWNTANGAVALLCQCGITQTAHI